jgi:hypothetical protein
MTNNPLIEKYNELYPPNGWTWYDEFYGILNRGYYD